ncbi:hypothetical protein DL96DRAFT_1584852 [Flagelloscypha sp. PMI_526]|nr:hypothetical protein DL96DRAFT_1584852 [Flagelloscypha sp. PMI_526]
MFPAHGSYSHFIISLVRSRLFSLIERTLPAQNPQWKDLNGTIALVTGANTGIGLEISRGLALRGATVVLACRNKEKGAAAKLHIVETSDGRVKAEQVEVLTLDLSDLNLVRVFAREWGSRPLDFLVNNAGYELMYATNVLSHYLLTLSLIPYFRPHGRIINVSSQAHYRDNKQFDILDLDHAKAITALGIKAGETMSNKLTMLVYGRTKCLQVFFTMELQRRLNESRVYKEKGISVHAFHPGIVRSELWDRPGNMTFSLSKYHRRMYLGFINLVGVSTRQGAATGLFLAASDIPRNHPGLYWYRMGINTPNHILEDTEMRKLIFDELADQANVESELRL